MGDLSTHVCMVIKFWILESEFLVHFYSDWNWEVTWNHIGSTHPPCSLWSVREGFTPFTHIVVHRVAWRITELIKKKGEKKLFLLHLYIYLCFVYHTCIFRFGLLFLFYVLKCIQTWSASGTSAIQPSGC